MCTVIGESTISVVRKLRAITSIFDDVFPADVKLPCTQTATTFQRSFYKHLAADRLNRHRKIKEHYDLLTHC